MNTFKFRNGFFALAIFALSAIISGCGSSPIVTEKFDGYSQAKQGEPFTMKWKFKNATMVQIDKFPNKSYKPNDSLKTTLDSSQVFNFTIIKNDSVLFGGVGELKLPWNVKIAEKSPEPITRGPLEKAESKISVSNRASGYLIGVNSDENKSPEKLRILNLNFQKGAYIKAALLDGNGNLTANQDAGNIANWKISINGDEKTIHPQISAIKISKFENASDAVNFNVLVDYSAEATYAQKILAQTKKFSANLKSNDNSELTLFNQKILSTISLNKNLDEGSKAIFNVKPSGLNACYKALYKTLLKNAEENSDAKKAITLITQGNDNASIIFTAADCIALANQSNTSIYVIAIGDYAESYLFQPLCDKTGGAYYSMEVNDCDKISDALTEIYASVNNYIQIDLNPESVKELAKTLSINLVIDYKSPKSILNAELLKTHMFIPPFPRYQAIATFDENSGEISAEYDETIKSLAELLILNPNNSIELVSHKRNDESEKIDVERAQKVWDALFANGASTFNQVKMRSAGSKNPANYFELDDWQKLYNRRVDIRWLLPDNMPFELSLESEKSEQLALKKVAQWEKRGFKSYFDRIINASGEPTYKIKLWGYKTIAQAEEEAEKIFKKYKTKCEIE